MIRKSNFLFIQADQLTARVLSPYGNKIAKTPNIDRLADQGVVFDHAYCNYPLCAPSRFSMMSGLLATHAGAYDNGAEFPASLPTFIHYLRLLGYQTCLSGKMHFIGPDQLHGFEERLTTDIYPSDFNWTANWGKPSSENGAGRLLAAAGEAKGILQSGIYERTIQLDYDDEVAFKAVRKIHDLARSNDKRPFCLFVSFTHPHDPFAVPRKYWDRYRHEDIDMGEFRGQYTYLLTADFEPGIGILSPELPGIGILSPEFTPVNVDGRDRIKIAVRIIIVPCTETAIILPDMK
jgi:choline-sulfatase